MNSPLRIDIQALRGLAVLSVIAFHVWPRNVPSGYLGVDIFFVISGYLMARLYAGESAVDFYRKRMIRLLPAYFFATLLTLALGLFHTTPHEYASLKQQVFSSALFGSNFHYWSGNSYFESGEYKPLLHFWSLSVEVQFYALVPLLVMAGRRSVRAHLWIFGASLAACILMTQVSAKMSFFWLPFRMWEFMAGFMLASHSGLNKPTNRQAWSGAACMVALALVSFVPTDETRHPGVPAVLTVAATAAVLGFGLPAAVLSSKVAAALAKVGDYSYSAYLVHFPILIAMQHRPFSGNEGHPFSLAQTLLYVVATVIASYVSKQWIEGLWRSMNARSLLVAAGMTAAGLCTLAWAASVAYTRTFTPVEQSISASWDDRKSFRCGAMFRVWHPRSTACPLVSDMPSAPRALLIGDSHADALKDEVAHAARRAGIATYLTVKNAALTTEGSDAQSALTVARDIGAKFIVIHNAPWVDNGQELSRLATMAAQQGISVAYLEPVPVYADGVPSTLWTADHRHAPPIGMPRTDVVGSAISALASTGLAPGRPIQVFNTRSHLCMPDCVIASPGWTPYYFDSNHLTRTGASLLRPQLEAFFQQLSETQPSK